MGKRYLKDMDLYGEVDHTASQEQFLETYAKLDTLTHGSKKMLVWKCPKGHESWVARISTRSRGSGCPCCSGHRTGPDNSLSVLRPGLASEWDREKNGGLTPYDVTVSSSKKVWWVCDGDYVFVCTGKLKPVKHIYPELLGDLLGTDPVQIPKIQVS